MNAVIGDPSWAPTWVSAVTWATHLLSQPLGRKQDETMPDTYDDDDDDDDFIDLTAQY